jgi:hypothetical protein
LISDATRGDAPSKRHACSRLASVRTHGSAPIIVGTLQVPLMANRVSQAPISESMWFWIMKVGHGLAACEWADHIDEHPFWP